MTSNEDAPVYTLGDCGQTVKRSVEDFRGRAVKDKGGRNIGKIADLLVDDQEDKVRFLLVEHGGFLGLGGKRTLIPVDTVTTVNQDEVDIDQSGERVAGAPGYDRHLVNDRAYYASLYHYYGYRPYWGAGYMYPLGPGMGDY